MRRLNIPEGYQAHFKNRVLCDDEWRKIFRYASSSYINNQDSNLARWGIKEWQWLLEKSGVHG